ncbi:hypothetical protein B0T20DRAFT_455763 [Sordaria brevicollis]|uniref:Nudix hydrolase domain-containing protein n=1 Tax=Sordaria brevicollis TaxID=83679 RepID=A0AAE0P9Y6_SORBR|nr:hypothetical protein B0T20DRAFT_455763 [Sordaria brevicollis]
MPPSSSPPKPSSTTTPGPLPIRPSSSVILLSPTNQILLLHRVAKSSSFASAHVFPGGNLSSFHEGDYYPLPEGEELHVDSEAYRLAAVRETFEESGILLARRKNGGGKGEGEMLELSEEELEEGRKVVFGDKVRFGEWLDSKGGVADIENLHPFTRWITPANQRRRFTTQMYLYMLPLLSPTSPLPQGQSQTTSLVQTPTHDGGIEHTSAIFSPASTWLSQASAGDIILYPPQFYLLTLIARFLPPQPSNYAEQRENLLTFLRRVPTSSVPHPTSNIPWAEKVMSPEVVGAFAKATGKSYGAGRVILGLAKPGRELLGVGSKRGGDVERVVLVDFRREEVEETKEVEERDAEGKVVGVRKVMTRTAVRVPRDLEVVERGEALKAVAEEQGVQKGKKKEGSKL